MISAKIRHKVKNLDVNDDANMNFYIIQQVLLEILYELERMNTEKLE